MLNACSVEERTIEKRAQFGQDPVFLKNVYDKNPSSARYLKKFMNIDLQQESDDEDATSSEESNKSLKERKDPCNDLNALEEDLREIEICGKHFLNLFNKNYITFRLSRPNRSARNAFCRYR